MKDSLLQQYINTNRNHNFDIYLKNGVKLTGKIVEQNDEEILIQNASNLRGVILKSAIASVFTVKGER